MRRLIRARTRQLAAVGLPPGQVKYEWGLNGAAHNIVFLVVYVFAPTYQY